MKGPMTQQSLDTSARTVGASEWYNLIKCVLLQNLCWTSLPTHTPVGNWIGTGEDFWQSLLLGSYCSNLCKTCWDSSLTRPFLSLSDLRNIFKAGVLTCPDKLLLGSGKPVLSFLLTKGLLKHKVTFHPALIDQPCSQITTTCSFLKVVSPFIPHPFQVRNKKSHNPKSSPAKWKCFKIFSDLSCPFRVQKCLNVE